MAELDLLAESSVCGQTLLRLASRSSAIITELLRLSKHVPPVFLNPSADKAQAHLLNSVVFDYRYLKATALFESKIENSAELLDFDANFRESYVEILGRFYDLFESIYKYVLDFLQFIKDLESGVFIQQTLASVLLNDDGKQLLCENLYAYGIMLILMEQRIDGVVRERLLVSYLRYKNQNEGLMLESVMKLCERTGFSASENARRPANYPESLFARLKMPANVVSMVIGRLRSDDVYHQVRAYPLPEHRSTALATQAAMIYVILYFAPDVLQTEMAIMREIVDKHFPDNWVINYYLGFTVDLSSAWAPYKAASVALNNTLQVDNALRLRNRYYGQLGAQLKETRHFLTEGVLTDEFILDSTARLLDCIRVNNVALRWLHLHFNTQHAKLRGVCRDGVSLEHMFVLLLETAQFEYQLKLMFEELLEKKEARWAELRTESVERMKELSEYFSGEKALTRVARNEQLMEWFKDLASKIAALDYNDSTLAGRKIQHLVEALEEVESFWQIEDSVQVVEFLKETRQYLKQMIRTVNVQEEVLVTLGTIADMTYDWQLINQYVPLMHEKIRRDPTSVVKLRSVFLKVATTIYVPLIRINQAGSDDLYSVSEFHSSQLVRFVRKVLEIIPRSMFVILKEIILLITTRINELPPKIDRNHLRDVAQLDDRNELARLTHQVSVFTEGILAMETTLVGVIEVDPKQLLEDGVRKQLVREIAEAMDAILVFKRTGDLGDFQRRLQSLHTVLDGFRRSFQYIQDYINIQGLQIWQEEFSRIINFFVQMECNAFLKVRIAAWQSEFQSEHIPIPTFAPRDARSVNCIGRLARELLSLTDANTTLYLDQMSAWYDRNGREVVGIRTFTRLLSAIDVFGLSGLDRLYGFMIVRSLRTFVASLRAMIERQPTIRAQIEQLHEQLTPVNGLPVNTAKVYAPVLKKTAKLFDALRDAIAVVGQMQLLRRQIAATLNFHGKLDSKNLLCVLDVLNRSVLHDVQQHYLRPSEHPYPDSEETPLLVELAEYLERTGINDVYTKIYIATEPLEHFALLVFLLVTSQLRSFVFNRRLGILYSKKEKNAFDESPFVVGVITLLKQFHSINTHKFLALMGQFIKAEVNLATQSKKCTDYPPHVINSLVFLEHYCRLSHLPRKVVEGYLPQYIFDQFTH